MHRTLQYAILFIVMVILQIFLFSRIGISVYVHPLVCIAFIVLLPMEIAPLALLGLGLLLGVTLDFFMATAGIHTVAALLAAFCRPALLNVLVGKDEVKDGGVPNVNRIRRQEVRPLRIGDDPHPQHGLFPVGGPLVELLLPTRFASR